MDSGPSTSHTDAKDNIARSSKSRGTTSIRAAKQTAGIEGRPVKRARNTKSSEQKAKGPPRVKHERTSVLSTLPLEIFHKELPQISGLLPPEDLIQLSRTSKAFRKLLLSPQSLFLWKDSYDLLPDAPPCPDDISVRAWAHLLFGGAYCSTCGTRPVKSVLFILRRRACRSCMKKHLLGPVDVLERFGVAFELLMELPRPSANRKWWDEDVAALQRELDDLLAQHQGIKSAAYKTQLAEIRAAKKAATELKMRHTAMCIYWEESRAQNRTLHLAEIKAKRFEDIKRRLLALNYETVDIDAIRDLPEVLVAKPMSDRAWARSSQAIIFEVQGALDKAWMIIAHPQARHFDALWTWSGLYSYTAHGLP
ncbi:hypothetical protein FA95DRAFT_1608541 [Auriscalpium vulgare]|uniref:Uncharacterized protein n=1 Tax=Auriscalpium vulgare TaxID=40419 RepID=A0ACB8RL73_9AGAM|nr:hypothetical protein FA95DRAFT_1608541 [Auriscalpium vulgare]